MLKRGLSAFILLLSITISLSAQSNVKIKTRIEIGQKESPQINGLNKSGSLPANYYIVEETSSYLFEIMLAAKNSVPPEDEIIITFHDTTITICPADYINQRDSWNESGHDYCQQPPVNFTQTSYYSYDPTLAFMIPDLHQGDTLRFDYHNCTSEPAYGSYGDIEFVIRDVHGDACHAYYEGSLQDLLVCGLDLYRMKFFVWGYADTLTSGSSTTLSIYPYGDLQSIYPAVSDSLITIEVDSAQYAKFIYDRGTHIDTLDSPLDSVKCSDAMDGKIKFLALGKKPNRPTPVAFCVHLMSDPAKLFEDTIVVKGNEIMLGETKYYHAAQDNNGKVAIYETSTPTLPAGAIAADIWGDNPVTAVQIENEPWGRRLGVYWEKEKPIPDGTGNLPPGMIRLIGRYWHKDSIYVVKLSTATGNASLGIQVERPNILGDQNLSPTNRHSIVKDAFNSDINLDSLIIKYAGENGIPPQLIKGMMEQECMNPHTNVFEPVWRYEPMTDLRYQENKDIKTRLFPNLSPFVKSVAHPKGTGDWPYDITPAHVNVFPTQYIDSAITIGSYISTNWDKYKRKGKLGEPDSVLYSADLSQRFKELYKPSIKLNGNTDRDAKRSVYNELYKELKEAETDLAKRYNIIAQTRIVTSYGFTQLMYSMTIDNGGVYNKETDGRYAPTGTQYMDKLNSHQYPEKLNEYKIFMPIYSDRMLRNLNLLFTSRIPPSNWSTNKRGTNNGYEANWKASLYYYNPDEDYPNKVMTKSNGYGPK